MEERLNMRAVLVPLVLAWVLAYMTFQSGGVVPTVRYQYLLVLGVLVSLAGSVSVVSKTTNSPTTISLSGSGVPPVSTGSQFYVSPTGNDANSGTSSSAPWRTIQKAMNSATAGSVVNIMAGTYHERLTLGVSGTAGNYITFQPNGFSVPSGGCGGYTGVHRVPVLRLAHRQRRQQRNELVGALADDPEGNEQRDGWFHR